MKVSNLTDIPQMVGIILQGGIKTTVRVMGRKRRVDLPPGATIDPRWTALNPNVIAAFPSVEEMQIAQEPAAPALTPAPAQKQAAAAFTIKQNPQAKE